MLLVSRTTLWSRVQNLESSTNRYTTISDAELDELIPIDKERLSKLGNQHDAGKPTQQKCFCPT